MKATSKQRKSNATKPEPSKLAYMARVRAEHWRMALLFTLANDALSFEAENYATNPRTVLTRFDTVCREICGNLPRDLVIQTGKVYERCRSKSTR